MYKSLLFLFLLFANSAYANIEEIINRLQPYFPNIIAEQINESQLDGFYEVIITQPRIDVMYISSDARYVLQGTVTDLVTMSNLSAIRINATRKRILDNIDENSKIVFKAGNEQYIVHVARKSRVNLLGFLFSHIDFDWGRIYAENSFGQVCEEE